MQPSLVVLSFESNQPIMQVGLKTKMNESFIELNPQQTRRKNKNGDAFLPRS